MLMELYVKAEKTEVILTKHAIKDLKIVPEYIKVKFLTWAKAVELFGLQKVRINPGYHDEPLRGEREGQRSIRLSKGYRAIYVTYHNKDGLITEIVEVQNVNKHKY